MQSFVMPTQENQPCFYSLGPPTPTTRPRAPLTPTSPTHPDIAVAIEGMPLPVEIAVIMIGCALAVVAFKAYIKMETSKPGRGKVMWLWNRLDREYKARHRKSSEPEYSPFHAVGVDGAGGIGAEEEKGAWNGEEHGEENEFEMAPRR